MPSVGSGSRVPPGGTPEQVLRKKSGKDFDYKWDDVNALQGVAGPAGPQGVKGDKGDTGTTGPKGDTGAAGATGSQGPKGDTGAQGATGSQGPKGDAGAAGPGVPVGGSVGQVLTKTGSADYVTGWAASGGSSYMDNLLPQQYQSQFWYSRRNMTANTAGNSGGNYGTGTQVIVYAAMLLTKSVTIDRIAVCSSSSAAATSGAVLRLGTYSVSPATGMPNALLTDFGSMPLSTSTATLSTMTVSGTLPAGWFFWALSFNSVSAGTLYALTTVTQPVSAHGVPTASFTGSFLTGAGTMGQNFFYQSGTVGATALPASATPLASYGTGVTLTPDVFFRVA